MKSYTRYYCGSWCSVRLASSVSHLFFADDSYIFRKTNRTIARGPTFTVNFREGIWQQINVTKSSIFFSKNTFVVTKEEVCGMLGFHEADENSSYLGLPNIIGRKKTAILRYLKDKVQKRVQEWDSKLLNKGGKKFFSRL